MDCRTTRTLFSEHYDRRVKGVTLTHLKEHLESCSSCHRWWQRYGQVFDFVASSSEPEALRPFDRPSEPPASVLHLPRPVRGGWQRFAVAASIIILFGVSNFVLFRVGQSGLREPEVTGRPKMGIDSGAVAVPAAHLVRETRERWRDHLDFTNVTLNQLARLGPVEAYEGNELAQAKLDLLRADDLADARHNDLSALGPARRYADQYLRSVRDLVTDLNLHISKNPGRSPAEFLNEQPRQLHMLAVAMRHLWAELNAEASGTSWNRRAARLGHDMSAHTREVRSLLEAEQPFLSARYSQAEKGFRSFRSGFPKAKLDDVARYMLCETLTRMRRFDEAVFLARGLRRPKVTLRMPSVTFFAPPSVPPEGSTLILQGPDGSRQIQVVPGMRIRGSGVPSRIVIEVKSKQLATPAEPRQKLRKKL